MYSPFGVKINSWLSPGQLHSKGQMKKGLIRGLVLTLWLVNLITTDKEKRTKNDKKRSSIILTKSTCSPTKKFHLCWILNVVTKIDKIIAVRNAISAIVHRGFERLRWFPTKITHSWTRVLHIFRVILTIIVFIQRPFRATGTGVLAIWGNWGRRRGLWRHKRSRLCCCRLCNRYCGRTGAILTLVAA